MNGRPRGLRMALVRQSVNSGLPSPGGDTAVGCGSIRKPHTTALTFSFERDWTADQRAKSKILLALIVEGFGHIEGGKPP